MHSSSSLSKTHSKNMEQLTRTLSLMCLWTHQYMSTSSHGCAQSPGHQVSKQQSSHTTLIPYVSLSVALTINLTTTILRYRSKSLTSRKINLQAEQHLTPPSYHTLYLAQNHQPAAYTAYKALRYNQSHCPITLVSHSFGPAIPQPPIAVSPDFVSGHNLVHGVAPVIVNLDSW